MKGKLDEESRSALIRYRLQRAEQTLDEAKVMSDATYYNAAINRLYYACYYAVVAALLSKGLTTTTHAGVKTLFSLHFIASGILPKECGKTFSRLFEMRHSSDYDDFIYCDKEMVDEFTPKARGVVDGIKRLIL